MHPLRLHSAEHVNGRSRSARATIRPCRIPQPRRPSSVAGELSRPGRSNVPVAAARAERLGSRSATDGPIAQSRFASHRLGCWTLATINSPVSTKRSAPSSSQNQRSFAVPVHVNVPVNVHVHGRSQLPPYDAAMLSSLLPISSPLNHRPRTMTPALRATLRISWSGFASSRMRSARLPGSTVPDSLSIP